MLQDPLGQKEPEITDVLEHQEVELEVPYTCYYEEKVQGSDRCFGYAKRGSSDIYLFQLMAITPNKNESARLLSILDMDSPEFLESLIEEARVIVRDTPMDVENLNDLKGDGFFIGGQEYVLTYQSKDVFLDKKSLYGRYCERVIRRNSKSV